MIEAAGYMDCGGRQYNEDSGTFGQENEIFYAIMADGLGGQGGGKRASKSALQTVEACVKNLTPGEGITRYMLEDYFSQANDKVLSMQSKECEMMTTLAVLCVDENKRTAVIAHLGDSRIYHFIDGMLESCTFDHSVSRMAVLAGEIAMDEIRSHADRNKLLKAIGKSEDVKAETADIDLTEGNRHAFLLCTDGFWEYVTEAEMEEDLSFSPKPKEWIDRMRSRLLGKVDGKNDNNSAVAVFYME